MSDYLLDTNHLTYLLQRHPRVTLRYLGLPSEANVFVLGTNVYELHRWLVQREVDGEDVRTEREDFSNLVDGLSWLPLTMAGVEAAAEFYLLRRQ